MSTVIVELLPMILGAALTPIEITIVLLMLASRRGLAKAAAFVLGVTVVRLLQGVLFGIVFGASPDATAEDGGMSPVTSTLLLVVGILCRVALAFRQCKYRKSFHSAPRWPTWPCLRGTRAGCPCHPGKMR